MVVSVILTTQGFGRFEITIQVLIIKPFIISHIKGQPTMIKTKTYQIKTLKISIRLEYKLNKTITCRQWILVVIN